jgi:Tfp pilus assembly protein PilO
MVGLAINLVVYSTAIYPQAQRIATAKAQAETAAKIRTAAANAEKDARVIAARKIRINKDLERFYTESLPDGLAGARRITYLRLARLAESAGLRYERRTIQPEVASKGRLGKLNTTMVLAGEYANIRRFIYALETAEEFVIIEDILLAQASGQNSALVLTIQLATYYRPENTKTKPNA